MPSRLLAALLATGLWAQQPDQPADPAATARRELAERIVQDLDTLAAHSRGLRALPLTPPDVVARVGREPEALFAWLRRNTRFVPYSGSLRGPDGVLADGTGNSLDRALLLAAVLRAAGHEARLARGTLPTDAAQRAIEGWAKAAREPWADELPADYGREEEDALALAAATLPELQTALAAGDAPAVADAAALATDHWWVQLRNGATWQDCDLLATAIGQASTTATATIPVTADGCNVPATDEHSVEIRVVVEQLLSGQRHEHLVLTADLPVGDWHGAPLAVSFFAFDWPTGLQLDGLQDNRQQAGGDPQVREQFQQALLATKQWLPILHLGKQRVARASFDTTGAIERNPALDGRSKLGRSVQRGFDAFGGGEAGPQGQLTAAWLEFIVKPVGRASTLRRHELFDLLGPAARAASRWPGELTVPQRLERALALLATTDVLLLGGDLPAGVVARRDVEARLALRPRARALLGATDAASFTAAGRELLGDALAHNAAIVYATLRYGLTTGPREVYLDAPNVACSRVRSFWAGGTGQLRTAHLLDVISNDVAVLPGVDARAARLRQGVLDTAAEDLAVGNDAGSAGNTLGVLARARAAAVPVRTLRTASDLDAVAGAWPADAVIRARADLDSGAVLVAPERAAADTLGWWRIDPRTGTTLGAMASGFHQGNNEYAETTAITNPLMRARRLLEFLAKPGNRNLIYRARNGSRVPANLAQEWETIAQIQARAAQALYEAFGTLGL